MLEKRLKVAVLVPLGRAPHSGGHTKVWERLANAAAEQDNLPLDLTVYFLGDKKTETLSRNVRFCYVGPFISTRLLKFITYVPDHTDLAPFNPYLARELSVRGYDVIHTTDGYFSFSRTAAIIAKKKGAALVTSFHTDTPNYTRLFSRQVIERLFKSDTMLRRFILQKWNIPERQGRKMENLMLRHLSACDGAMVKRDEDFIISRSVLPDERISRFRGAVNKDIFGVHARNVQAVKLRYGIPQERFLVLFVGRIDDGKNIRVLMEAMRQLIAEGMPLHLIAAGLGHLSGEITERLGNNATIAGFLPSPDIAMLMASVDVVAVPSEIEVLSTVVIEGLASGAPLLVSEATRVRELCKNTDGMLQVSSGVDAWREALRKVASPNSEQLAIMRHAAVIDGKKIVADWREVIREDFLQFWQKMAARKKA